MSAKSLVWLCEQYFIELFKTHPMLKRKQYRHEESDEAAEPNVIIVNGKQGEDLLEGPQGPNGEKRCKVEVTIRYQATGATDASENDHVTEAMQNCIRGANKRQTKVEKTPGFWLMILNEDIRGDRSHSRHSRAREMTIPCEAGILLSVSGTPIISEGESPIKIPAF